MKKHVIFYTIFCVFVLSLLSGCVGPQISEFFNEEYSANENTIIRVTTINGQIEISSWDGDTVKVDAVKKTRIGQEELDLTEITVDESNDILEITVEYTGSRVTTPSVDLNIKIPSNVTVETATTSNGQVIINGVKGDIQAQSSNGGIFIEDVDGYVSASTTNGQIDIESTTGVGDISTSNGRISVEISDFQQDIKIETSNGRIQVYVNPDLDADLEMTTSNGDISISSLSLNLTTSEDKYKAGTLGLGGNLIDIETSNGDIELYQLDN